MKVTYLIAKVLLIVGGLNWGLFAVADLDLVAMLFGAGTMLAKVVYSLVGLAAVYQAICLVACCPSKCNKDANAKK